MNRFGARNRIPVFAGIALLFLSLSVPRSFSAPLSVHPQNPRYFADTSGKAISLAGSHLWNNFVDWGQGNPPPPFDPGGFVAWLKSNNHNFVRGWVWENTKFADPNSVHSDWYNLPVPWLRSATPGAHDDGAKFDLTKVSPDYLNRVRDRCIEFGENGIYVGVMLFQPINYGIKRGTVPPEHERDWWYHPFHSANNVNGIDGDTNGDGQGWEYGLLPGEGGSQAVWDLQLAYVEAMIDHLNDLDNILWEIGNEGRLIGNNWQDALIDHIHAYELTKPKRHLVWKTAMDEFAQNQFVNSRLFNSNADAISPNHRSYGDYRSNPPASDGNKIIISDTDHLWGIGGDVSWVWKTFLRGNHPIFMDPIHGGPWNGLPPDRYEYEALRDALGHTVAYSERIDLANALPQDGGDSSPCSTGYCLYDSGKTYLAYQPGSGPFDLDLEAGAYGTVEWLVPDTGVVTTMAPVTGPGVRRFTPPFEGDAVLLVAEGSPPAPSPTPAATATGALYPSTPSVRIVPPPGNDTDGLAFRQLFEAPELWQRTRSKIDSIGYYDHRVNRFSDEELRHWFSLLKTWDKRFFIETGAVNEWCPTGQQCFDAIHPLWDRFLALGADIDAFAMDEPFFKTQHFELGSLSYAVDEVANWIALVRQDYPDIAVGSIEPYPSLRFVEIRVWIDSLNAELAERGVRGLDFFCLDVDWRRFPEDGDWFGVKWIEDVCRERNIPFSLIYWASETPNSENDGDWYDGVMRQGQAYRDEGGQPDEYVIQSWLPIPDNGVPESAADTVTGTALDFIERFVEAPTVTPTPTSSPTPSLTPTPTRNLDIAPAEGLDGKVDAKDLLLFLEYVAGSTEAATVLYEIGVGWKTVTGV